MRRQRIVFTRMEKEVMKMNANTETMMIALPQSNGPQLPEVVLERGLDTQGEPPTPLAQRPRLVVKGKGPTAIKGHGPRSRVGAHSDHPWKLGAVVSHHPARHLKRV